MNFKEWLLSEENLQTLWDVIIQVYDAYLSHPSQTKKGDLFVLVGKIAKKWYIQHARDNDENRIDEFSSDIIKALAEHLHKNNAPITNIYKWLGVTMAYTHRERTRSSSADLKKINGLRANLSDFSQRRGGQELFRTSKEQEIKDYKKYTDVLRPEHNRAIQLYSQGMTYEKIAEYFNRPLSTVKQWFRQIRILTNIAMLHDDGYDSDEILERIKRLDATKDMHNVEKVISQIKEKRSPTPKLTQQRTNPIMRWNGLGQRAKTNAALLQKLKAG